MVLHRIMKINSTTFFSIKIFGIFIDSRIDEIHYSTTINFYVTPQSIVDVAQAGTQETCLKGRRSSYQIITTAPTCKIPCRGGPGARKMLIDECETPARICNMMPDDENSDKIVKPPSHFSSAIGEPTMPKLHATAVQGCQVLCMHLSISSILHSSQSVMNWRHPRPATQSVQGMQYF
jgi:hypothetical protein